MESAAPDRQYAPFPFRSVFNLQRLIALWKEAAEDETGPWPPFARAVLEALESAPELAADEVSREAIERHRDVVDLMMSAVFPRGQWDDLIGGVMKPFATEVLYTTPTCDRLGLLDVDSLHERMNLPREAFEYGRTMMAYFALLERLYGVEVPY
ncbi:MAG: hypothetical protein R3362_10110, partial [Rhodothermales bacterium]|nr:hypothetical protein [Rhodothermales bacterium]